MIILSFIVRPHFHKFNQNLQLGNLMNFAKFHHLCLPETRQLNWQY